jgi:ABC-type branched-subunit amino acid transport system substrate-binding protein
MHASRFRTALATALLAAGNAFAADLLIGNVASTSNAQAAQNSGNIVLGYTVYFEDINSQGGIRGRQVRLINKDDGLVPDKMVALAQEFIADPNVIALAGFLNTPGLVEIMKRNVLVDGKIAMVAPIGPFNATNFYPVRPGYNDEVEKLLSEAKETQKKRVGLVYYNQAFAPGVFKFAEESAKRQGVNVVATAMFETDPAKIEAGIVAAAGKLAEADPDAVIVIAAGAGAFSFVKHFRSTSGRDVQLYTLSPVDSFGLVKAAGVENARGVVISQAMPYPYHTALAVVREYQKAMKKHAPDKPFSFYSLEGFIGAKIVVEALKRAGPNPTREKVIVALNGLKEFDVGDFTVQYSADKRIGSKAVDLTIIGKDGTLFR